MIEQRLDAVRATFPHRRLDALLVTSLPHIRYLTNFSGSNALCLIKQSDQFFLTDGRYTTQSADEVRSFTVIIAQQGFIEELSRRALLRRGDRVGIQDNDLTVQQFATMKNLFPRVRFVPAGSILDDLVAVKDAEEIGNIEHAAAVTDRVFEAIVRVIRPGMTELDVAAEISYLHKKFGAEGDAFEPIVASGTRGALPHARASMKQIRSGEMVTLDFGCRYRGYHSDLTRTVAVGRPSPELRRIYSVVLQAQAEAIRMARAGIKARSLDAVARGWIKKAGFGRYFTHSLGHGLGLQVHELPRISRQSPARLAAGNVVTIEPGIYVPDRGGVRIEDDVVIEDGSCRLLTKAPKKLLIL
jgi:Xaa-Pro aminopeptidase